LNTTTGRSTIAHLIEQSDPLSSRKHCVTALLALWHQPRPNADLIPADVDDAAFFDIAARQYGLRSHAVINNWALVQRLNLPAIVAMRSADSSQTVFLMLVGWRGQKLYFEDERNGGTIEADMDALQPYLDGRAYVFWKNVLGYDMIIRFGAKAKAILEVKNLLRKIGYNQLDQSPSFDQATLQAVIDFQARHQLSTDGLVGTLTKIMLLQKTSAVDMPALSPQGSPST
jgi:hypothetical protein